MPSVLQASKLPMGRHWNGSPSQGAGKAFKGPKWPKLVREGQNGRNR